MSSSIVYRKLGLLEYAESYAAMSGFTSQRDAVTRDEIWSLQHPPVYTLGLAGRREHILDVTDIPIIETDRGGQVTYHGPGQVVLYLLLDLRRLQIGIKDYVYLLEQSLIDYLQQQGLAATRKAGAPGVYIDGRKIAALGVRVRRGSCYHGLALNVSMDLSPFKGIHPCGYQGLEVTQMADFGAAPGLDEVAEGLTGCLIKNIVGETCKLLVKRDLSDLFADYVAA